MCRNRPLPREDQGLEGEEGPEPETDDSEQEIPDHSPDSCKYTCTH